MDSEKRPAIGRTQILQSRYAQLWREFGIANSDYQALHEEEIRFRNNTGKPLDSAAASRLEELDRARIEALTKRKNIQAELTKIEDSIINLNNKDAGNYIKQAKQMAESGQN